MSVKVTFNQADGSRRVVDVEVGTNLMRAAVEDGVPGVEGECGGEMSCATCHVYVEDPSPFRSMSADEDDLLDAVDDRLPSSRLACQLTVRGEGPDITVTVA